MILRIRKSARERYSHYSVAILRCRLTCASIIVLPKENSVDHPENTFPWMKVSDVLTGRRRKEHLKSLEQAQKEQSSEQSGEIDRLRYQNAELKRENDVLKAQLYGTSINSQIMPVPPIQTSSQQHRSYSASPSITSSMDSLSGTGSPSISMGPEMMSMPAPHLTTTMMARPSMPAYADALAMTTLHQSQPYSMVHPSGTRQKSQSSPESSEYGGSSQPTVGPQFQSLTGAQSIGTPMGQISQRDTSNTQRPKYFYP